MESKSMKKRTNIQQGKDMMEGFMETREITKPEPCPFCGTPASYISLGTVESTKYFCGIEGCPANTRHPTYALLEKWNKRVLKPTKEGE